MTVPSQGRRSAVAGKSLSAHIPFGVVLLSSDGSAGRAAAHVCALVPTVGTSASQLPARVCAPSVAAHRYIPRPLQRSALGGCALGPAHVGDRQVPGGRAGWRHKADRRGGHQEGDRGHLGGRRSVNYGFAEPSTRVGASG